MAGLYPPGYSYIYGPPGGSDNASSTFSMQNMMTQLNSTMRDVAESMRTAAQRISGGVGTGVSAIPTALRQVNPSMGSVAPSWVAGQGQMFLQPPSLFNTLGVTPQRYYGPGYPYSPGGTYTGGALGATMAGERHFQKEMLWTSVKGRAATGVLDAAGLATSFIPGGQLLSLPLYAASALVGGSTDIRLERKRIASEIYRSSPAFMPPSTMGGIRGGFGVEQAKSLSNEIQGMFGSQQDVTMEDLRAMVTQSMRSGWYRNVKDSKQFMGQFREYVSTVKDAAGILDKSVVETGQLISTLKNLGARGKGEIRNIISAAKVQAMWSGADVNTLMGFGVNTGQALGQQYMMNIGAGSRMSMGLLTGARTLQSRGMISTERINAMGGLEGVATGASQMISNFNSGPMAQALFTRLANIGPNGQIGFNDNFKKLMAGGSIGDVLNKPATMTPLQFAVYGKDIMGQLKDQPQFFRKVIGGMMQNMGGKSPEQMAMVISAQTGIPAGDVMAYIKTIGAGNTPNLQRQQSMIEFTQAQKTASIEMYGRGPFRGITKGWRNITNSFSGKESTANNVNVLSLPGMIDSMGNYGSQAPFALNAPVASAGERPNKLIQGVYRGGAGIIAGGEGMLRQAEKIQAEMENRNWFDSIVDSKSGHLALRFNQSKLGSDKARAYFDVLKTTSEKSLDVISGLVAGGKFGNIDYAKAGREYERTKGYSSVRSDAQIFLTSNPEAQEAMLTRYDKNNDINTLVGHIQQKAKISSWAYNASTALNAQKKLKTFRNEIYVRAGRRYRSAVDAIAGSGAVDAEDLLGQVTNEELSIYKKSGLAKVFGFDASGTMRAYIKPRANQTYDQAQKELSDKLNKLEFAENTSYKFGKSIYDSGTGKYATEIKEISGNKLRAGMLGAKIMGDYGTSLQTDSAEFEKSAARIYGKNIPEGNLYARSREILDKFSEKKIKTIWGEGSFLEAKKQLNESLSNIKESQKDTGEKERLAKESLDRVNSVLWEGAATKEKEKTVQDLFGVAGQEMVVKSMTVMNYNNMSGQPG